MENIKNEVLYSLLRNSAKNCLFDNGKFYSYNYILEEIKKYECLKGYRVGINLPKGKDLFSIVIAAFIYDFSFTIINTKLPKNRKNMIIEDAALNYIIDEKGILFIHNRAIMKENEQYICYTSGSTGSPKGVIVGHKGLYNVISQQIEMMNLANEKIYWFVSESFDASISDILCSLLSDSCLYINETIRKKPNLISKFLIDYKISYMDFPPSYLRLLNIEDNIYLKKILIGGESPQMNSILKCIEKGIRIFNVYGPTEASICTSMVEVDKDFNCRNIGNPLKRVNYKIVDGELLIGGVCLAIGYTDNKLTDDKFFEEDGILWYRSGDLTTFNDNTYYFQGRSDTQVKINGQLINLGEIESLLKEAEGVDEIICFLYKNKIELIYTGSISKEKINKIILLNLPSYMLPHKITKVKKMLFNQNDKIDRSLNINIHTGQDLKIVDSLIKKISYKPMVSKTKEKSFLITGGTGFLGSYLIKDLLSHTQCKDIHVLVRNNGEERLKVYFKENFKKEIPNNVFFYKSNLFEKELGLKKKDVTFFQNNITDFIHSAAEVNNLKPLESLWNVNIQAATNTVNMANKLNTRYHFISSLSVWVSTFNDQEGFGLERDLPNKDIKFHTGYARSKWIMDKTLSSLGNKNIKIYRLGLLTEDSATLLGPKKSFFKEIVQRMASKKIVIENCEKMELDITPVNYASNMIVNSILFHETKTITNVTLNMRLNLNEISNYIKENNNEVIEVDYGELSKHSKLLSLFIVDKKNLLVNDLRFHLFEMSYREEFEVDLNILSLYNIDKNLNKTYIEHFINKD